MKNKKEIFNKNVSNIFYILINLFKNNYLKQIEFELKFLMVKFKANYD